MKRHLAVAGRGLAAVGLTGWLAYLIATKTSSVAHPPGWPYWLCLGMLVAGISLYFLGQQRSVPSSRQTGKTDQQAAIDQNADDQEGERADHPPVAGRSVTVGRQSDTEDRRPGLLQALTPSAWIAALLLTVSVAVLQQFRHQRSLNISFALQALSAKPVTAFLIMVVFLAIATLTTQVFYVNAIKILEGYWGGSRLANLASRLMIQRNARRKATIHKRLLRAYEQAFTTAKPRMLRGGMPPSVVDAFEAMVLGKDFLPTLSDKDSRQLASVNWRDWCDSWRLAQIDSLITDEIVYPMTSRIMPTKLGNIIRATEDQLRYVGDDPSAFVLRLSDIVPRRVQMQHDFFRNRLDIYCTLVLVSLSLVVLTPTMLLGRINIIGIAIIAGAFAALSAASYRAAISSANGYCATLREMDKASTFNND